MLFFLLSGRLPFIAATVKDADLTELERVAQNRRSSCEEFPKAVQQEPDWAPALAHSSRLLNYPSDWLSQRAQRSLHRRAEVLFITEGVKEWDSSQARSSHLLKSS